MKHPLIYTRNETLFEALVIPDQIRTPVCHTVEGGVSVEYGATKTAVASRD